MALAYMQECRDTHLDSQILDLTKQANTLEERLIGMQKEVALRPEATKYYTETLEESPKTIAALREIIAEYQAELITTVSECPNIKFKTSFEVDGWDVQFNVKVRTPCGGTNFGDVCVELKPSLGDDYPAVLRQMRANTKDYYHHADKLLVFERFSAAGASLEQVRAIFKASNFERRL